MNYTEFTPEDLVLVRNWIMVHLQAAHYTERLGLQEILQVVDQELVEKIKTGKAED